MEIAVTVPYEIKIDAEGINLDSFDCFFTILKDSVSYSVELDKKENFYILKIPKELSFLGDGKSLKYEITVKKENAVFIASEGELTVLGMVPSQFKVDIKAQDVKKKSPVKTSKKEEKETTPKKDTTTVPEKPPTKEKEKEELTKKKVEEKEQPVDNFFKTASASNKFSFLNNLTEKEITEIEENPNDPNVKLRKIISEIKKSRE